MGSLRSLDSFEDELSVKASFANFVTDRNRRSWFGGPPDWLGSGGGARSRLIGASLAVVVLALCVISGLVGHSNRVVLKETVKVEAASPPADFTPTLANYRAVANESLDQFDNLLTQQAAKAPPPPAPLSIAALGFSGSGD